MTDRLRSFGPGLRCAVIGASGGLGHAMVEALSQDPMVAEVYAFARRSLDLNHPKVKGGFLDTDQEDSIEAAASQCGGPLHVVLNITGILHDASGLQPEKTWRTLSMDAFEQVFRTNTFGPGLVAKHFVPLLDRERKSCFAALSARVGSISDNRAGGWHAYRASKTALNMLLKNFAIELARKNQHGFCIGLHPGTVDSGLSKPFQKNVPDGKLFTPAYSVSQLLSVINGLDASHSGKVFAWDGLEIEP